MRIISFSWLVVASVATADEAFVSAMLDCSSLSSPDERLACYDGVVTDHAGHEAEPAGSAMVDSEDLFGMSPAAAQRTLDFVTGQADEPGEDVPAAAERVVVF